MGESTDIRARAVRWREAARESRDRARRVVGLGAISWDAPAADAFRERLRERAAGLGRLADLEECVAAALDDVAVALDRADAVLTHVGRPPARGPRGGATGGSP
jgi:hypothetical protein